MLRRNLLLSSLAFCLPSVMAQAKGKRAVVAYFSWYDNTFQERIRPSDIDETTSASLKAPGQVTLVAHWIGKDLGKLCKMLNSSQWPLETEFSKDLAEIFHSGGVDWGLINQLPPQ